MPSHSIHRALSPATTLKRLSSNGRSDCVERPEEGVVAAAGVPLGDDDVPDEAPLLDGDPVGVEFSPEDVAESSPERKVLDSVAIVIPKRSVVGGGKVVISAA